MNITESGELTFLDILSVVSFAIAVLNLDANLDQNDKAELQEDLSNKSRLLLDEIHAHLQEQDDKLNIILKEMGYEENKENDTSH